MRFSDKIAIVTGGSTGIGRATILMLASEGAKVYNLDIVEVEDSNSFFVACDISDYTQVQNAVKTVFEIEKRRNIM